ncbi:glycoside hydrolase family 43 protein [Niabella aurantiaca]|uniref:glycoside hydrolase family 43 protein n=1 Tax=Niabella aurantiaca TaxID=379900 RepID=UPI0003A21C97|nr:glycoside hydrolase family 43 protein [Niabella aurantiaca]
MIQQFKISMLSGYCILGILFYSCSKGSAQKDPVPDPPAATAQPIYQADPTIFLYQGKYYLYGTDGSTPDKGIRAYVSPDKKKWEPSARPGGGFVLTVGESFGTKGFWAPQVWYRNSKFYMAYVANEQIAIAISDSPEGPFSVNDPIAFDQKNIDPYVFFDDDGKKYLYHVDITNGNKIYVAAINDDFTAIDKSTRALCITATAPWETIQARVTEGPTVLKHKGVYYLVYSANHFENQQYAVGYATASNPMGPWTKAAENPILSMGNTGKPGIGHGDIFADADGSMYYVCHTHNAMDKVSPRRTAMVKAKFVASSGGADKLVMDTDSFTFLKTGK